MIILILLSILIIWQCDTTLMDTPRKENANDKMTRTVTCTTDISINLSMLPYEKLGKCTLYSCQLKFPLHSKNKFNFLKECALYLAQYLVLL